MFDFERWADWLQIRAAELSKDNVPCSFVDGRLIPELTLNPSYRIELTVGQKEGWIQFWGCGTCDYQIYDFETENHELKMMLEPTDSNFVETFEQFVTKVVSPSSD